MNSEQHAIVLDPQWSPRRSYREGPKRQGEIIRAQKFTKKDVHHQIQGLCSRIVSYQHI